MTTTKVRAYAAETATSALAPLGIARREPGPLDVEIEILYCGVCHSDVHQARNEWHNTIYPCVPGHEIVGRVTRVGSRVTKFRPGDLSAVGCMVDSCRTCPNCRAGFEQYCLSFPTFTYNGDDKYLSLLKLDGTLTLVGAPEQPLPVSAFNLLLPRRNFAGSAIGGIAETQEMLDFCATHGIVSDIELIPIQKINEAWDRLLKQEVRYRFVIDMASLKS